MMSSRTQIIRPLGKRREELMEHMSQMPPLPKAMGRLPLTQMIRPTTRGTGVAAVSSLE